ncbi:unnamed protein product [Closterium sp. Yama58-4]|nr:unnamed protein product [Closterium sp. Yama58-4]
MDGQGRSKPDREDSSKQLQEPGQLLDTTSSSELAGAAVDATSARRGQLDVSRHNLPLSSIVNQAAVKEALLAAAVDPGLGGVALVGGHGTGKTVMARALPLLLPPIAVVDGSWANADPRTPEEAVMDAGSSGDAALVLLGLTLLPLGVTEDRLLGSVDVEASIHAGRNIFLPGLLAQSHRGVLYIDDANLLDDALAALLFAALAEGCSVVEREGLSVRHACRPLLLASFNPQEGALRRHLLDRIALIVRCAGQLWGRGRKRGVGQCCAEGAVQVKPQGGGLRRHLLERIALIIMCGGGGGGGGGDGGGGGATGEVRCSDG